MSTDAWKIIKDFLLLIIETIEEVLKSWEFDGIICENSSNDSNWYLERKQYKLLNVQVRLNWYVSDNVKVWINDIWIVKKSVFVIVKNGV